MATYNIGNRKHLTLADRAAIEHGIQIGENFSQIARKLNKDSSTISKEIRRHIIHVPHYQDDLQKKRSECQFFHSCDKRNVCGNLSCRSLCFKCRSKRCAMYCRAFTPVLCDRLKKPPYVCNNCNQIRTCSHDFYFYRAHYAHDLYNEIKVSSRSGINQTPESLEQLDQYLEKRKEYTKKLYTLGDRNSYSKTDPDATFMRMKEDAMLNGQLKPAYNIQHGVDSEYITWIDISPHPTDTRTLIPFLKDMENHLGFRYSEVVADAGYESEENYLFIEGNGQTAYIKPQNYEISKTRKYKKDISRRENMEYHADRDSYICRNGRELTVTNERRSKTASGYVSVKTYYRSPDCTGCPYKTECIKGNNCKTPMEKRNKVLMVSKTMSQKRAEDLERITSEYGTMLRMNRSIQAEGSFADVKEDMNFRRYLYRGKANALAESILLAMGRNINKLHCKIQTGRTGSHLFSLKTA